jgi:hypothetical protein
LPGIISYLLSSNFQQRQHYLSSAGQLALIAPENITAIPVRKSKDAFIFNKFNSFQKENTLVFFDCACYAS